MDLVSLALEAVLKGESVKLTYKQDQYSSQKLTNLHISKISTVLKSLQTYT